jgi:LmbE family N-acetylglucosaminyl deacetylase
VATIVYVTPHQDDETLSMGASVRLHVEAGHDVHVLLLTAGSGSGAQAKTGLDDVEFSAARDDEYRRACRAMGVRSENVHFSAYRAVGETVLSVADAQAAIADFIAEHPAAWVKTYTNRPIAGQHVDHTAAGQATANLLADGTLAPNTVRFYVPPWCVAAFQSAYPSIALGSETAGSSTRVRRALDEYCDVDHVGGKYGIGYISVPTYINQVRSNTVSRYHVP